MEFSQEISYVVHSPTCSTQISSSTEEDDDMAANCLILLAQGGSPSRKISSRKFSDMAAGGAAKAAGLFVYECKTCNRTFPSFQALGGHRASHKKPKLIDHHEHHNNTTSYQISTTSSPASGLGPGQGPVSNGSSPGLGLFPASSKAKIHECSICGAEFSSGQALGGHMRRHRPPPSAISATTAKAAASVSNSNGEATEESCDDVDGEDNRRGAIFALDLNLPAPQDDEEEEGGNNNKFEFSAKQQQNLVFSVPPLVDCHY